MSEVKRIENTLGARTPYRIINQYLDDADARLTKAIGELIGLRDRLLEDDDAELAQNLQRSIANLHRARGIINEEHKR